MKCYILLLSFAAVCLADLQITRLEMMKVEETEEEKTGYFDFSDTVWRDIIEFEYTLSDEFLQWVTVGINNNPALVYSVADETTELSGAFADDSNIIFAISLREKVGKIVFNDPSRATDFEGEYSLTLTTYEGTSKDLALTVRAIKYCSGQNGPHPEVDGCQFTGSGGCNGYIYQDPSKAELKLQTVGGDDLKIFAFERTENQTDGSFKYYTKPDQVYIIEPNTPKDVNLVYNFEHGEQDPISTIANLPAFNTNGCPDWKAYCTGASAVAPPLEDVDVSKFDPNQVCAVSKAQPSTAACRAELMPAEEEEFAVLEFNCKAECRLSGWSEGGTSEATKKTLHCGEYDKAWVDVSSDLVGKYPVCDCTGEGGGGGAASLSFSALFSIIMLIVVKAIA